MRCTLAYFSLVSSAAMISAALSSTYFLVVTLNLRFLSLLANLNAAIMASCLFLAPIVSITVNSTINRYSSSVTRNPMSLLVFPLVMPPLPFLPGCVILR